MFKNKFFLGFLFLSLLGILYYSLSDKEDFNTKTLKGFEKYQSDVLGMAESPIPNTGGSFDFFPPNEDFLLEADFKPESGEPYLLNMTDSTQESAALAGTISFSLKNKSFEILIFDEGENYLLPFTDLSNGSSTYGGGRYLNIPKNALLKNKLTVDFNAARNFYCAYNDNFICPIPPQKNHLDILVEVGEKNFQK
jgi:uncharacterized protein (DUF1684 family)